MKKLDLLAAVLLIVGGLNWGLVAIAKWDLVAAIFGLEFGETNAATRVVYGLVGLAAVSGSYNPAHTTLKDAGLEVCSESQSQSLPDEPGAQLTKTYYVAPDCHGAKVTPNVVTVYQFSSQQSVDSGYPAIKAAAPASAATEKCGPVVIVVTGPNADQYLASIDKALKATQGGSNPPTTT